MFWTTRRLGYVAASKHAITIGEEQTVRFAVEGDSLFVRDEGGKEQRLELVKIAQVAKAEAIPQSEIPSAPAHTPESTQRSPEAAPTLRRLVEARNEELEHYTISPQV